MLVAQQLALLMVTYLANHRGADGSVALYTWAYAIYLLPFAVLVQPVTTAVFPRLAARDASFDRLTATSTRAVLLAAGAGAALLGAAAVPIAWVFAYDAGRVQEDKAYALADALMVLAPALIGFGALMHAGRVLYARHAGRPVAVVTVAAWLLTAVACVVATTRWDGVDVVPDWPRGCASGCWPAGWPCWSWSGSWRVPRPSPAWRGRCWSALFAAALAGFVGRIVASPVSDGGWQAGVLFAIVGGLAGLAAYGVLALLLAGREARQDVRMVLRRRSRAMKVGLLLAESRGGIGQHVASLVAAVRRGRAPGDGVLSGGDRGALRLHARRAGPGSGGCCAVCDVVHAHGYKAGLAARRARLRPPRW